MALVSITEAPKKKLQRAQSRETYRLTDEEAEAFRQLRPVDGVAFKFWQAVAADRGLDYRTILGDTRDYRNFTALPLRHGRPWCWPSSLECKKGAPEFVPMPPRSAA